MVSEHHQHIKNNGKPSENTCKWLDCRKSTISFKSVEHLLEHVFDAHIPKIIKNEDDEEEVICEWEDCEMGTTRGGIQKKTDWMKTHFKTRHAKAAKTFKCLFEDCSVMKATSQEMEVHLRVYHPVTPKKPQKPARDPTPAPEKPPNRIWKIVNGDVVWDPPMHVTTRTIVHYDDGPRYVFPSTNRRRCRYQSEGSELGDDEYWEVCTYSSDEETPLKKQAIGPMAGNIPRPGERERIYGRPYRVKKKLSELKKEEEEKEKKEKEEEIVEEKEVELEILGYLDMEKSTFGNGMFFEPIPTKKDLNEDDLDKIPDLKAYFEESDLEEKDTIEKKKLKRSRKILNSPKKLLMEKIVKDPEFDDVEEKIQIKKLLKATKKPEETQDSPQKSGKRKIDISEKSIFPKIRKTSISPKKEKPLEKSLNQKKRPSRTCKLNISLSEIDDEIEAFEVIFDSPPKENLELKIAKMKKALKELEKIQKLSTPTKSPHKTPRKSETEVLQLDTLIKKSPPTTTTLSKSSTIKKTPSKKKLILKKRPSRACRALGSMEEVPFDIEIGVDFEI